MKIYSVKDIADKLNVSKTTIQRIIKKKRINPIQRENQKYYYSSNDTITIIKALDKNYDVSSLKDGTDAEPPQTETPTRAEPPQTDAEPPQTETPQTSVSEEILLLKETIKIIQQQLEVKDKQLSNYEEQIKQKDKQIEDYSSRLKEAIQLTRGQQYITAADKTSNLLNANNEIKEKQGFFERIFKRRK